MSWLILVGIHPLTPSPFHVPSLEPKQKRFLNTPRKKSSTRKVQLEAHNLRSRNERDYSLAVLASLGGDQRFLLLQCTGHSSHRRRGGLEVLSGCYREVGALVLGGSLLFGLVWRGGAAASIANQLLCFGRVVADILLSGIGGASSVVAGDLSHLLGLLVDDARGIVEVVVNELLVGLVDKRAEEQDRGRDKGKAPEGNHLNQEVGDEGTEEGLEHVRAVVRV